MISGALDEQAPTEPVRFFKGGPGHQLGRDGRYELRAKLGAGISASAWLARDRETSCKGQEHVAVKILSGLVTEEYKRMKYGELDVGLAFSTPQILPGGSVPSEKKKQGKERMNHPRTSGRPQRTAYATRFLDHFFTPEVDARGGEHLCLVTELYPTTLDDVIDTMDGKPLPVGVVKRVLRDVTRGLAELHEHRVAHTGMSSSHAASKPALVRSIRYGKTVDLSARNIMVDPGTRWKKGDTIDTWLKKHPPMKSSNSWVPQPGLPLLERLESCSFVLSDFGHAQFVDDKVAGGLPYYMRTPETTIGLDEWDEKVDIWTFGALAFGLLTNAPIINPLASFSAARAGTDGISLGEGGLYQMICATGDTFSDELLSKGSRTERYFVLPEGQSLNYGVYLTFAPAFWPCAPTLLLAPGKLRHFDNYEKTPIWMILLHEAERANIPLTREDVRGITDLLEKCLRIDPAQRASAKELALHPWLRC